jgi:hypothetical protein
LLFAAAAFVSSTWTLGPGLTLRSLTSVFGSLQLRLNLGVELVAGEQAGFSLKQMIELLDHGLSVETRSSRPFIAPSKGLSTFAAANDCFL